MTIARILAIGLAFVSLAACAGTDAQVEQPRPPAETCIPGAGQAYIGRQASAEAGAELLRLTNTREIRWGPPGVMMTMDYKFGRLTVSYDENMLITTVACG